VNLCAPLYEQPRGDSLSTGLIIGAGAGALIGEAIDDGDVVCR
jgi:hypothetical protein